MDDKPGDGVDHDDLPTQPPGIVDCGPGATAPFSVVDSQQSSGVFYQEAVAVQHTIFMVGPADIDDGIRPVQNRMIEVL